MNELNKHKTLHEREAEVLPDLTDPQEARKAFISGEIFNRKY